MPNEREVSIIISAKDTATPVFENLAKATQNFKNQHTDLSQRLKRPIEFAGGRVITEQLYEIVGKVPGATQAFQMFGGIIARVTASLGPMGIAIAGAIVAFKAISAIVKASQVDFAELEKKIENASRTLKELEGKTVDINVKHNLKELEERLNKLQQTKAFLEFIKQNEEYKKVREKVTERDKENLKWFEKYKVEIYKIKEELEKLSKSAEKSSLVPREEDIKQFDLLREKLRKMGIEVEKLTTDWTAIGGGIQVDLIGSISVAIDAIEKRIKSAEKSLQKETNLTIAEIAKKKTEIEATGKVSEEVARRQAELARELKRQEEEKRKLVEEFNKEYRKSTLSTTEYEIEQIKMRASDFIRAGADAIKVEEWKSNEIRKINEKAQEEILKKQEEAIKQNEYLQKGTASMIDLILAESKEKQKEMIWSIVSEEAKAMAKRLAIQVIYLTATGQFAQAAAAAAGVAIALGVASFAEGEKRKMEAARKRAEEERRLEEQRRREQEQAAKEAIEIEDNKMKYEFEHNKISYDEYIAYLKKKQKAYKEYSSDWMRIQQEIEDVEKRRTEEIQKQAVAEEKLRGEIKGTTVRAEKQEIYNYYTINITAQPLDLRNVEESWFREFATMLLAYLKKQEYR
jgi:hypothetical protein